jgi:hypothetical protein
MGILPFLNLNLDHHSQMFCESSLTANANVGLLSQMFCESSLTANANVGLLISSDLISVSSLNAAATSRFQYIGDGGVTTDGSADTSYNLIFLFDIEWKTKAVVEFTKEFVWNTGQNPLRWYRVLGCCKYISGEGSGDPSNPSNPYPVIPGGCDVTGIQTDDPRCTGGSAKMQFVQNLLGRSVSDICDQLKTSGLKWEICSIKRWSRPVDILNNDECNELTEVPFSEIPECIEFSLASDQNVKIGARTFITGVIVSFTGSGGVVTGGTADSSSDGSMGGPLPGQSMYEYLPTGMEVLTGGSAETSTSFETNFVVPMGMSVTVENIEAIFGVSESADLSIIGGSVNTACGTCDTMPQIIYMHHNLNNDNAFKQFVTRNGLKVPNPIILHYSARLKSWNGSFQLYGEGSDNTGSDENWRFLFEWTCINELAAEDLGASSWKFSMFANRKNTVSNFDSDTRILIVFPPEQICKETQNLDFDFSFNLNTETNFVGNNLDVPPSSVLLKDNIGLFKSKYWDKNPNLVIRLSRNESSTTFSRQDLSNYLPTENNLGVNNTFVVR